MAEAGPVASRRDYFTGGLGKDRLRQAPARPTLGLSWALAGPSCERKGKNMKGMSIRRALIMFLCLVAIVVVCLGVYAGTGTDVEAALPSVMPSIIGPLATIDPSIWGEILDLGILIDPDDPVVEDIDPNGGLTAGGEEVVITGANFINVTEVSFGGTPSTDFTVDSSTKITALVPMHAPGTVQVQVTTSAGPSPDTSADDYTYVEAPTTAPPTTAAPTTEAPTTEAPTTAPPTTALVTTTVAAAEGEDGGLSGGWIAFIAVIAVVAVGGMGMFVYRLGKGNK